MFAHGLGTQHKHKSNIGIVVSGATRSHLMLMRSESSKTDGRRRRLGAAKKSIIIWAQSLTKDRIPPAR
jgi:hypothetical protein